MRTSPLLRATGIPLLLAALTLLHFAPLAFSGLIPGRGDTFNYFYPWWTARNAALLAGELPLWSPDIFMGVPLLANPQAGVFYPPNWLTLPLDAPAGIRLSILLHVFFALWGMYRLARRSLQPAPALAAALLFGLGGYVGAHVEQINQLQGMAWTPWLLLWLLRALQGSRRCLLLLPAGLALQFLSGHVQLTFISGIGLALAALLHSRPAATAGRPRQVAGALTLLLPVAAMALLLAAPQLLPTLELSGVSQRSGGLTAAEALTFSFSPLLAGRGLLPGYEGLLFGEYVAYSGVIGLGLALLALFLPRRGERPREALLWAVLALAGLTLALGEFNPLWKLLVRLPGFNFFRVPARWLLLFATGSAMLSGHALQALLYGGWRPRQWQLLLVTAPLLALMALSPLVAGQPGAVIGQAAPTALSWLAWALALVALLLLLRFLPRLGRARGATLTVIALGAELFLAGRVLPFNQLLPPETWREERHTVSRLRAWNEGLVPPERFLSISELLFEPGDQDLLQARHADLGLSPLASRWALVATKRQEILAPNLALARGLPGVDGFGGGLLPTRWYTAFSQLLDSEPYPDGRLHYSLGRRQEVCRHFCVPEMRWLQLTNTRYLIGDRTQELRHAGVTFDTQLAQLQGPGLTIHSANPEAFGADALDLLVEADAMPSADFIDAEGRRRPLRLTGGPVPAYDLFHLRLQAGATLTPERIEIRSDSAGGVVAATLVDTRSGDYRQLTPDPWRRLLAREVKVYVNDAALPRAFIVPGALLETDDEAALAKMRNPQFDPQHLVLINSPLPFPVLPALPTIEPQILTPPADPGTARITRYTATEIDLAVAVDSAEAAWLVISDAWYPGWEATVDGAPFPLLRGNLMFRVIAVPQGRSEVSLRYRPAWLPGALLIGAVAWLLWLPAFGHSLRRKEDP